MLVRFEWVQSLINMSSIKFLNIEFLLFYLLFDVILAKFEESCTFFIKIFYVTFSLLVRFDTLYVWTSLKQNKYKAKGFEKVNKIERK